MKLLEKRLNMARRLYRDLTDATKSKHEELSQESEH
jgi:hypothetical protein